MTEKERLLQTLIEKTGKSQEELQKLIAEKINELSGLISEEGAIYILANEMGVRIEIEKPKRELPLTKIADIKEPKTPVSFTCKIIRIYDRVTFTSKTGTEGSVRSILVGDETGIIRIVFWNDKTQILDNLHEGDILNVINAYTRENLNTERIEVHYGQYSDIDVNPKGIEITLKEYSPQINDFTEKKISETEEGERNIKIKGIITDFDIPRFYLGCPDCFKKVFQDEGTHKCAEHSVVEPMRVPIVNLIIDDSTASIPVVGFRDRAEQLTGINSQELISLSEDIEKYRNFSKKIIGSQAEIIGNIGQSNLTGEKQLLANQIIERILKTIDETETPKEETSTQQETEKETTEPQTDDDIEIEEIEFDDDLL